MKLFFLLLTLTGAAFAADPDLTPLLTATKWKYDQDNVKDRTVRFRPDGTCEATTWKGLWKQTGPRTVEITLHDKRKATLVFGEDTATFTGVGFDRMEMRGKRLGDLPAGLRK